ncbi:MAG: PepSY domain-containing protein [Acidimicrobiia bacterium]
MEPMHAHETGEPAAPRSWKRSWIATAALATGLAVGAAGLAGAATGSSSSSSSDTATGQAPSGQPRAGMQDPATMSHGPNETLLTGDTATKVKDAALAAVPGATVIRVETDSGGAAYEAHLKKSDGSYVTVEFDSSFNVTSTDQGFGPGPQGQVPRGPAPQGQSSSTTSE